jgi:AcrR family transcriptional regulator
MVTPVKGMSARAVQAERTRQQILATAQRLFTERGYDATSLQMIADEMGLTIRRLEALLDEAAGMRGRRARMEHLVDGFVDFLVQHRQYAVMASTDPAAKRNKLDGERATMSRRALTVLFGENPTGAERLAFNVLFFIPECLPELADLTDDELREALRTTILRMLRG